MLKESHRKRVSVELRSERGVTWEVDVPEEGTAADGVMSGHWNGGCLKRMGRVFSGNVCKC